MKIYEINWNGRGRNDIFNDTRFKKLWWVESNWTYNGMFEGDERRDMFKKLSTYGEMGSLINKVTEGHDWAQYFSVGDTPSVTYLLDKEYDINDLTKSTWAGLFKKPFPNERPNYYTDDNGPIDWDYAHPCKTWKNNKQVYNYNKSTLVNERPEMYKALLKKLNKIYRN